MSTQLELEMGAQPDQMTCGPTCLHALYRYYGEEITVDEVINECHRLESGGTLAVFLACHALRRGYDATIYTYNLQVFDPTWFEPLGADIHERLLQQMAHKPDPELHTATRGYLEFLERGGRLRFVDLTTDLIRGYLKRAIPILAGLSATYLYQCAREYGPNDDYDDVRGEPSGHFVVLTGYDPAHRNVLIADPLHTNPVSGAHQYSVSIDRAICAILLGVLTHDANLLILRPSSTAGRRHRARSHHR